MDRVSKLRAHMEQLGVDGMLITNAQNRRYLTGFTGTAGVVLVTKTQAKLLVDYRYVEQARQQAEGYEVELMPRVQSLPVEVSEHINAAGIAAVGFEQEHLSYSLYNQFQLHSQAELVPTSGVIETFRMIKSAEEIRLIETAAEIADAAFTHILGYIRPGITELEVSNELEFVMRKHGATSSAYDTIVASGYRAALPHGVASKKQIERGEMITMDFGALYQGYRSDLTRTIAVGEPPEELKNIYAIVLASLERALAGIKPGISGRDADALARDYIAEKGYAAYAGQGLGHGVGLDIHEEPFMSARCDKIIQPGMLLTVEPGIYLPNTGGVRIEDDIIVTEDGNQVLTHSAKELIIL